MNVVDSSAWLEYFAGSVYAERFQKAIENTPRLIVPVITIYEVFKKIIFQRDENSALIAIAHMQQGRVVDVDSAIALNAAKLSIEYKIPMADSLILATARKYGAVLWTQDEHFSAIDGVRFFAK
jgi:predicted nucleic acid-binding protein